MLFIFPATDTWQNLISRNRLTRVHIHKTIIRERDVTVFPLPRLGSYDGTFISGDISPVKPPTATFLRRKLSDSVRIPDAGIQSSSNFPGRKRRKFRQVLSSRVGSPIDNPLHFKRKSRAPVSDSGRVCRSGSYYFRHVGNLNFLLKRRKPGEVEIPGCFLRHKRLPKSEKCRSSENEVFGKIDGLRRVAEPIFRKWRESAVTSYYLLFYGIYNERERGKKKKQRKCA